MSQLDVKQVTEWLLEETEMKCGRKVVTWSQVGEVKGGFRGFSPFDKIKNIEKFLC